MQEGTAWNLDAQPQLGQLDMSHQLSTMHHAGTAGGSYRRRGGPASPSAASAALPAASAQCGTVYVYALAQCRNVTTSICSNIQYLHT